MNEPTKMTTTQQEARVLVLGWPIRSNPDSDPFIIAQCSTQQQATLCQISAAGSGAWESIYIADLKESTDD